MNVVIEQIRSANSGEATQVAVQNKEKAHDGRYEQPERTQRCCRRARGAGLTREQMHNFTNVAASMAMEGMPLTLDELRVGAGLAAGRIDFAEYRRRLGV